MTTQNTLVYRSYHGSVEIDLDENILYGQVLWIRDLITYEGETIEELRHDFESAVDEYISLCERKGVEPKKPFTGTFQIRVGAELHEALAVKAYNSGRSLNNFVTECLRDHALHTRSAARERLVFRYPAIIKPSKTGYSTQPLGLDELFALQADEEESTWPSNTRVQIGLSRQH